MAVDECDVSQDEDWYEENIPSDNEVDENATPTQRRTDSALDAVRRGDSMLDSAQRGKHSTKYVHGDEGNKNFKVVLRIRPALPRELNGEKRFQNIVKLESNRCITVSENLAALEDNQSEEGATANFATYQFTFDHVYGEYSDQLEVYNNTAREAVESTLQGYNATIIAYGQTGTGKTYTMEGEAAHNIRGIIPRATEDIFKHIECTASDRKKFLVRASYLQIYNEVISDLLKPDRTNLHIREDKRKGVFVEGLSEWVVRSPKEVYGLMQRGAQIRATASTKMNEISSRSHAVFIIILEQLEYREDEEEEDQPSQVFKVGKLNLVDLAGSERVRLTGATGRRLEECKKINQSLSTLGNVIAALTTQGRTHIPYRDSKLTRILEDSLGGNCKTTMMAMISPALEAFVESLSTLKFANRAKNIKNEARVNEDLDQKALLRKYEREIKKLRQELDLKQRTIVDKRRVLQLEERSRQAEADKLAAIQALEERSREFMTEKQEKRRLEQRLTLVQSAMLVGGQKVEDTPAFRTALQKEHNRIHQEYEERLADLERERMAIEEDKAQVDRYKQLLLKQRDIMIALTARLNERDETITRLQEELDAYDQHQRMMEDILDQKTAALIHLQRVTMEQANSSPEKNAQIMQALGPWGKDGGNTPITPMNDETLMLTGARAPLSKSYPSFVSDSVVFQGGNPDVRMLSAEEKVVELQQLLDDAQGDNARTQQQLEDIQAEKVSLEFILREKLERMVQAEIEDRINEFRREQSQTHHTSPGSSSSLSSPLIPYSEDVQKLERELDHIRTLLKEKEEENRIASAKIEELQHNAATSPNAPPQSASSSSRVSSSEVQKLLERVRKVEEENNRLKQQIARSGSDGSHGNGDGEGDDDDTTNMLDKERIHHLEGRVESLRHQHQQFRQEVTGRFEQKNKIIKDLEEENSRLQSLSQESGMSNDGNNVQLEKFKKEMERLKEENYSLRLIQRNVPESNRDVNEREEQARKIAVLKQFCTMNAKERTALKTILEVKIKGLVDSVARNMADVGPDHRVFREVQSLQKLVNASVNAMKNDEHPPLDDMLREADIRST